jgi:cytidylate kinase
MPLITITRGSLSATFRLTQKLSELLGCKPVSREEVLEHAEKYGIKETGIGVAGFMEKEPPHFWDRHSAERRHYLTIFKAALLDYMVEGNAVYNGHLGQFLLSDVPKLLRVRANASIQFRVNTLMKESGMTEIQAEQYVKEIDIKRRSWAKFLYGVEFDSNLNFDLILNMDKMSIDTMAGIIACATERPEFKQDTQSFKQLKDAHLRAVIFAHLVRSPRTRGMDLKIDCDSDSGKVIVTGAAPVYGTEIWHSDIKDVVSKVPRVSGIEINI